MNFKTTALLVALLLVIGAVWLFYPKSGREETPGRPEPTEPTEREKPLLDPQPDNKTIARLTIERPGKPRMVFERSPKAGQPDALDDWKAVEPLALPVENYAVNGVVTTFTSLRSRSQAEPGAKGAPREADAGLAPPLATITLTDKSGKESKFEVGEKAPMSTDTYVRVAGQKVIHVVTRDLSTDIRKSFQDYRDKKLTALAATDAVRVEINTEGKACLLTRGEDAAWVIDVPVKAYAQKDAVLDLLRKIGGLRAQEFIEDAPATQATYGLDAPFLTLSVTAEKKVQLPAAQDEAATQPAEPKFETKTETFGLVVGAFADMKKENRFARLAGRPWVFSVKQKDIEGVVPDLVKLRDPKITRIQAKDANRLELTAEGTTAVVENVNGTWRGSGDLTNLETSAVIDLFEGLEDLAAIDYILEPAEPATYGLDQPRAVLTASVAGAVEPVTVRIGAVSKSGRHAYVSRDGQPTVFVVSAAQANRLAVTPLSLHSRSIFNADEGRIREVQRLSGKTRQTLEHEGREWELTEPAGAPVDAESARVLAGDLSRLRARRVVSKGDEAKFGIDDSGMTIRFKVETGTPAPTTTPASQPTTTQATPTTTTQAAQLAEHTLRVGRKDNVGYCCIDDDPYVFELDETVLRALTAELISRKLFEFKPEDVVGLTIVAPGGTLEFEKQDSAWKFTPDQFVKLAQKKVEDFVKELAALRVEQYVQYRDADFAAAGLFTAPATVSIRLRNGGMVNLKLTPAQTGTLPRLAGWVEEKRTFLLAQADAAKLMRGLDEYLETAPKAGETEKPEVTTPPPSPGRPSPAPEP